ncbi:hypothetical protein JHW43_004834 [Diplocarpon mali]|nr:hypothetical protein JHW43_004834 [Diplocarpon mali]
MHIFLNASVLATQNNTPSLTSRFRQARRWTSRSQRSAHKHRSDSHHGRDPRIRSPARGSDLVAAWEDGFVPGIPDTRREKEERQDTTAGEMRRRKYTEKSALTYHPQNTLSLPNVAQLQYVVRCHFCCRLTSCASSPGSKDGLGVMLAPSRARAVGVGVRGGVVAGARRGASNNSDDDAGVEEGGGEDVGSESDAARAARGTAFIACDRAASKEIVRSVDAFIFFVSCPNISHPLPENKNPRLLKLAGTARGDRSSSVQRRVCSERQDARHVKESPGLMDLDDSKGALPQAS